MSEIFKSTVGFMGILLVGLAGVFVFEFIRLWDTTAPTTTVDNVAEVR